LPKALCVGGSVRFQKEIVVTDKTTNPDIALVPCNARPKGQNGALCPACDRFIGPLDTCPYCDLPVPRTFSLRFLRFASLALAVVGMAALYLLARQDLRPLVKISEVTPLMNSASVRVAGLVATTPQISVAGNAYVSFPVTDGSNSLTVVAYDRCARGLMGATNCPRRGDIVEVSGTVSITRPGVRRIIMEAPEQLKMLTRAPARPGKDGSDGRSDDP